MRIQHIAVGCLIGFMGIFLSVVSAEAQQIKPEPSHLENLISGKKEPFNWGGSYRVVIFLSDECPCSMSHVEHFKELQKKFPDVPFAGVHSAPVEDLKFTQGYYAGTKPNFPVFRDDAQVLVKNFGALRTPHVFLLDKNQKVVYHGGATDSSEFSYAKRFYLQEALEQISKGESPKIQYGKPLGCHIYRR